MRSYTRNNGDSITVNEEHLKSAVAIKIELQKLSPSMRCSWARHKKMMVQAGFSDSDKNENYRNMIKAYQRSVGELPSVEKYADMVTDSKLDLIKSEVGELAYKTREAQNQFRGLRRLKTEIVDYSLVAEQIGNAFKNINLNYKKQDKKKIKEGSREMLVIPSDWHVGYFSDIHNHDIAKIKIDRYVDNISEYSKAFDVGKFHVAHMGDMVENLYMHNNTQAFNSEFNFSEQVVKATELLYYMIDELSNLGEVVFHGVIRGNHGRMNKKGETAHNDCAEYIVHDTVKKIISMAKNDRVKVDETGYNIERSIFEVKGKKIKLVHGDFENQADRRKIQKHISLENEVIDILGHGHFHNFQVISENHGRMVYSSGCLQGTTEYGRDLKFDNPASQGIIILGENEIIPINIILE